MIACTDFEKNNLFGFYGQSGRIFFFEISEEIFGLERQVEMWLVAAEVFSSISLVDIYAIKPKSYHYTLFLYIWVQIY